MNSEKQAIATSIKSLVETLQREMLIAQQLGLTVVLENSSRYLGGTNEVAVKIFEQVSY